MSSGGLRSSRSFARPPLARTKVKTAPRTACAHRIDALEWEPRSRNTTTEEDMAKVQKSWSWETTETTETDYEEIGEVEWSHEAYQFDLTRVYKQISTGALFYATDRGCSCPSPFEDTEDHELIPIRRMQDWHDHVTECTVYEDPDDEFQYPYPTPGRSIDEAHRLGREINTLLKADKGQGRRWEFAAE